VLSRLRAPLAASVLVLVSACTPGQSAAPTSRDVAAERVDSVETPALGACRLLTPGDVEQASNATEVVACTQEHTAETFAVGTFPENLHAVDPDDERLGAPIYRTCSMRFQRFLGGTESAVMRSTLTWAWFRPSDTAWEQGARWYRCDVVAAGEQAAGLAPLPKTAKGLLLGVPGDEWMVCAEGPTVAGSVKVRCSEPHTWRAVTTIKLGQPGDRYPGDRVVEVRTRDYCSDSVGAWMNYPVDYDFGYTYFHQAEWQAGNRRSICWAKTRQ